MYQVPDRGGRVDSSDQPPPEMPGFKKRQAGPPQSGQYSCPLYPGPRRELASEYRHPARKRGNNYAYSKKSGGITQNVEFRIHWFCLFFGGHRAK